MRLSNFTNRRFDDIEISKSKLDSKNKVCSAGDGGATTLRSKQTVGRNAAVRTASSQQKKEKKKKAEKGTPLRTLFSPCSVLSTKYRCRALHTAVGSAEVGWRAGEAVESGGLTVGALTGSG